jgi:hypothetical protein
MNDLSQGRETTMATTERELKKESENRFRKAANSLREMSPEDRIQMLEKAGLISQSEADLAKALHRSS